MPRKGKIPRFGAQGFPVRRDFHLDNQGPNRPLNSRIRATVEGLLSAASNGSNGSKALVKFRPIADIHESLPCLQR